MVITNKNKKVLRECKRHTNCSISSTPYAVRSQGGGCRYLGRGGGGVDTLAYPPVLTWIGVGVGTLVGRGGCYLGGEEG